MIDSHEIPYLKNGCFSNSKTRRFGGVYAILDMGSNKSTMSLRVGEGRAEAIRQVMQLADETTKAGAIDAALHHYIRDHRNKEAIIDELDQDIVEKLSTSELPMKRKIENAVGFGEN